MTSATDTTVHKSLVVNAPLVEAFHVFTEQFVDFKPREHNLMSSPIAGTVFETEVGGHIYDRAEDGTECHWARILAYEPPDRVVFSWDIGPTWQIETNPDLTSEVEVRFIAEADDRTRVERTPPPRPARTRLGRRPRRRRRGMADRPRPLHSRSRLTRRSSRR